MDGGGFQVVKAADGYLYGQFESLKHLDALVAWFDFSGVSPVEDVGLCF